MTVSNPRRIAQLFEPMRFDYSTYLLLHKPNHPDSRCWALVELLSYAEWWFTYSGSIAMISSRFEVRMVENYERIPNPSSDTGLVPHSNNMDDQPC